MSGHMMRFAFDGGVVRLEAVCNEPEGADCRLTSVACECESWGEIQRRDDGTIWHLYADEWSGTEYANPPEWHEVKPADYCNVCLFIDDDPEYSLDDSAPSFVVAEIPIEPVWQYDHCTWKPVQP